MTHRIVKVRHPRNCWCCTEKLPKGSEMFYSSGLMDGEWHYSWWCKVCDAFWDKVRKDWDEGINYGDFLECYNFEEFKRNYKNEQQTVCKTNNG